eukprot:3655271-Pyramimonas_sp.AAC.1
MGDASGMRGRCIPPMPRSPYRCPPDVLFSAKRRVLYEPVCWVLPSQWTFWPWPASVSAVMR